MNGMAAVRGLGPFVSWTLGKLVVKEGTRHGASFALRTHHTLAEKCVKSVCIKGKEGVTQLHQHVARHWMRASESQVASVSSKRPSFATKAGGKGKAREEALSSLQQKDQEALSTFFHEPKGPVTAVEGASYSVVIAGGLAIAATLAYYVVTELFVEKPADKVYNKALERIQQDPRVMVRLGSPIKGYGSDSRNRRARQRISHRMVRQEDGTEHCQVQFQASGPNGRATIHADMYEKGSDWEFAYLIVDVTYPPNARARINVQTAKQ